MEVDGGRHRGQGEGGDQNYRHSQQLNSSGLIKGTVNGGGWVRTSMPGRGWRSTPPSQSTTEQFRVKGTVNGGGWG